MHCGFTIRFWKQATLTVILFTLVIVVCRIRFLEVYLVYCSIPFTSGVLLVIPGLALATFTLLMLFPFVSV